MDLAALGPRTVTLDCDVLQADGGTRTASITRGFRGPGTRPGGTPAPGAVVGPADPRAGGCGERRGRSPGLLLDLDYEEDSQAAVDANFVGTSRGELIEVQLTGETGPFPAAHLPAMLSLAQAGLKELFRLQEEALSPWLPLSW